MLNKLIYKGYYYIILGTNRVYGILALGWRVSDILR